jgi:hypothetical protein
MNLTTAQLAIVKTAMSVDAGLTAELAKAQPDIQVITDRMNAASAFNVWKTTTAASDISDAITWANYTPGNPAAGAGQDFINWVAQCALKRDNLWVLLTLNGSGLVSTGKHNIQAGLQDALVGIPSGASGASRAGGWPAVQLVIQRAANRVEALFATGTGTTVAPGDLVFEGTITVQQVSGIVWNDNGTRGL